MRRTAACPPKRALAAVSREPAASSMHRLSSSFVLSAQLHTLQTSKDVPKLSQAEGVKLLNHIEDQIATNYKCIVDDADFARALSIARQTEGKGAFLERFLDVLGSGFAAAAQDRKFYADSCRRQVIEKYALLLSVALAAASKNALESETAGNRDADSKNKAKIHAVKCAIVKSLCTLLNAQSPAQQPMIAAFWDVTDGIERDAFFSCIYAILSALVEDVCIGQRKSTLLAKGTAEAYAVLLLRFPMCNSPLNSAFLQFMQYFEGSSDVVAETFAILCTEHQCSVPLDHFVRALVDATNGEQVALSFGSEVTAKNLCSLFTALAKSCPEDLARNLSFFCQLLGVENYSIRCGIVECIGLLYVAANKPGKESSADAEAVSRSLFNILIERILDVNSFVRAKVFGAFSVICTAGCFPAARISTLLVAASERLRDKTSIVRKKSLTFIADLVRNHPFSLDGGELDIAAFDAKIAAFDAAIEAFSGMSDVSPDSNAKLDTILMQKKYYVDASDFARKISEISLYVAEYFLFTAHKSEVNEAIQFLSICYVYKLRRSVECFFKMFPLVWSKDASGDDDSKRSVRENFLDAFKSVFFDDCAPSAVAQNLVFVATNCSVSLFANSLDEIVRVLADRKVISKAVCTELWKLVSTDRAPSNTLKATVFWQQRKAALAVICACRRPVEFVRLHSLIEALTDREIDWQLAELLCQAIQLVAVEGSNQTAFDSFLTSVICERIDSPRWINALGKAIVSVFCVHRNPEPLLEKIIKSEIDAIFFNATPKKESLSTFVLAKFLYFIGHAASLQAERIATIEETYRSGALKANNSGAENVAADDFAELLMLIREKDLLFGEGSLFSVFNALPLYVLNGGEAFAKDPFLVRMASICLAKLMCVSEQYFKTHFELFLRLLTDAADREMQSNLIVAFGDFCSLYPSFVGENVSILFEKASDRSAPLIVRRNALITLSYLILNGMIKVKGHLHLMALCVVDADERISQLASMFFAEYASKDSNSIYNNVHDLISNLSAAQDLSEKDFYAIIKFVLSLLKKDRQLTNVSERLLSKVSEAENAMLCKNLVFCVCVLHANGSERALVKLVENFEECIAARLLFFMQASDGPSLQALQKQIKELIAKAKKISTLAEAATRFDQWLAERQFFECTTNCHVLKSCRTDDAAAAPSASLTRSKDAAAGCARNSVRNRPNHADRLTPSSAASSHAENRRFVKFPMEDAEILKTAPLSPSSMEFTAMDDADVHKEAPVATSSSATNHSRRANLRSKK